MLFTIDPMHSVVEFSVQHLQISVVKGRFSDVHGTIEIDPQHLEKSTVQAEVQTVSIYTGSPQRDAHLRSADFLNVAMHPTMQFISRKVTLVDQKRGYVDGNMSLRGVTRPIQFQATFTGTNRDPLTNGWRIGLSAVATVDRREYGMQFQRMSEKALLIGNMVRIEMNVEAIQAG